MAMTKEELAKVLGKAQSLCSVAGDKKIDRCSNKFKLAESNPSPSDYDGDANNFDSMYLSEAKSNDNLTFTNEDIRKSNLPENIKASFMQKKIGTSNLSNISVLDGISVPKKEPIIKESESSFSSTNTIDYSIIKAIINDCLKDFFKEKNASQDDNYLKAIRIKEGRIKIIDNKGNIFSANLEKTGNINDKKQAN